MRMTIENVTENQAIAVLSLLDPKYKGKLVEEKSTPIFNGVTQKAELRFHKKQSTSTSSKELLDRLEKIIDVARWVSVNNYTECKEIIQQLRIGEFGYVEKI